MRIFHAWIVIVSLLLMVEQQKNELHSLCFLCFSCAGGMFMIWDLTGLCLNADTPNHDASDMNSSVTMSVCVTKLLAFYFKFNKISRCRMIWQHFTKRKVNIQLITIPGIRHSHLQFIVHFLYCFHYASTENKHRILYSKWR